MLSTHRCMPSPSAIFQSQILPRGKNLFEAAKSLVTIAGHTLVGEVSLLRPLFWLPTPQEKVATSFSACEESQCLLSTPCSFLIKTINPHAAFGDFENEETGIATFRIRRPLRERIANLCEGEPLVQKQGFSSLAASLYALAMAVAAVADAAIACVAVPLALISLGLSPAVNQLAWESLGFTGLLSDFTFAALALSRPSLLT